MTSEVVVVDALPYIDHGYDDPGVRESALAMVEEECRRYRPTKNYLEHLPTPNVSSFETKLMAQEFERIQNRVPMETLSMKRYELPPPPPGKLSEVSAWQEAIDNSMAQLEHQWVRVMNLELMLEYGIESWKSYLEVFVALQAKAQTQLQQIKKQIQDVNWQRKQAQTQAGEKLKSLEATWVLLVSKNYEIEQQCAELERQIQETRDQAIADEETAQNNIETENEIVNENAVEVENENEVGVENENGNEDEDEAKTETVQLSLHHNGNGDMDKNEMQNDTESESENENV